jgi:hypothetical protein
MAVIWLVRKWSKNMQFENQLGIAQSNMQRRGQIKASPVGSVPSRDVPTVDPQSARIARWNVVDFRSAGSATTTI